MTTYEKQTIRDTLDNSPLFNMFGIVSLNWLRHATNLSYSDAILKRFINREYKGQFDKIQFDK